MLNPERPDIHPGILAQAAEWFAVLGSGAVSNSETAQWQAWLQAHPDHQAAWARVEYFSGKFQHLPVHAASAALNQPDLYRRRTLKALAVFGAIGFTSWQLARGRYLQAWSADYQTALGSSRTVILADGSKVSLDTDSALNVEFTGELRRLQLVSGEIYIETAPDNSGMHRPFVVDSQEGRVGALGTRFSVRQLSGNSQVSVFADAVEIEPGKPGSNKRVLHAGQSTGFTQERIDPAAAVNEDRPAWTQGFLLADNMPLSEFLLQLNRYRHGYVTCDPRIAGLRIVGSFPLSDTDRVLTMLAETLPVKISSPMPLWVKVLPR
ncbi:FecR domain-containing protein [Methylomonas methanica]|uniref:Anti-FecI sigma factor, FecR n=1 Tax=Methylomonas methanica (strain DSM 25384 / MC09) TaxID=857087 RepID=F9ZZ93_METMM|nr:FecR domain-containing protein [Methylomonas methanica]AEG01119.1 anti-FecI sigma factor, FecR [Methylomonas methanica MC09]